MKVNLASSAPTERFIISKGQYLIDTNYDNRFFFSIVQHSSDEWWVWCFDEEFEKLEEFKSFPWSELTSYNRVRKIRLHHEIGNNSLNVPVGIQLELVFHVHISFV